MNPFAFGGGGPAPNPDLPWTAMQLHFEATTSGGLVHVDSSPTPVSVSSHGGGVLHTGAAKFGSKGLRTPSNPSGVYANDASLVVGTGDFCYDFWVSMNSIGFEQNLMDTRNTTNGAGGFQIDFHPTYGLLHYSAIGGGLHSAGVYPTAGVLKHFEVSRTGGTARMFYHGTLITSWADTNNYSAGAFYLGGVTYTPVGEVPTYGDWDELRILVGKGGHTSNFTPPTAAYGDT